MIRLKFSIKKHSNQIYKYIRYIIAVNPNQNKKTAVSFDAMLKLTLLTNPKQLNNT